MEYTNPVTGGPAMPTIGCYVQLLRTGEHTQAHRRTSSAAFHVVEGSGYSVVAGQRLDWEDKDVFCVPSWTFHEHVNTGDQLASCSATPMWPVMRSLDLYREEAPPCRPAVARFGSACVAKRSILIRWSATCQEQPTSGGALRCAPSYTSVLKPHNLTLVGA